MRNGSSRARRGTGTVLMCAAATLLVGCGGERDDTRQDQVPSPAPPVLRAVTEAPAMTDAQVAHLTASILALDAPFSERARARSLEPEIARLASTLLADHQALGAELRRVAAQPASGAARHELLERFRQEARADARLDSLAGPLFDRAYLEREAAFHAALLTALDETLIPAARDAELRALLENMRPAVEAHHQRARQLLAAG